MSVLYDRVQVGKIEFLLVEIVHNQLTDLLPELVRSDIAHFRRTAAHRNKKLDQLVCTWRFLNKLRLY
jgi:hypothetical protein